MQMAMPHKPAGTQQGKSRQKPASDGARRRSGRRATTVGETASTRKGFLGNGANLQLGRFPSLSGLNFSSDLLEVVHDSALKNLRENEYTDLHLNECVILDTNMGASPVNQPSCGAGLWPRCA
jgi:hypothetical protein